MVWFRACLLLFSSLVVTDSANPQTAANQANLSFTIFQSLLKLMTYLEKRKENRKYFKELNSSTEFFHWISVKCDPSDIFWHKSRPWKMSILFLHVIKIYSDCNCKQQLVNNFKTEPEGSKREALRNKIKLGSPGRHINFQRLNVFFAARKTVHVLLSWIWIEKNPTFQIKDDRFCDMLLIKNK